MCGRFTLAARPADLARAFPWAPPVEEVLDERYNVAPTQEVLSLVETGWRSLRWGLVPHWAKDVKSVGARYLNARVESIAEKAPFKRYYEKYRCLLPATGFYEWKAKTPFYLQLPDEPVLALAGLWASWGHDEERVYSCTVVTRPSYGPAASIHDRLPVVLSGALAERWLNEPLSEAELLAQEPEFTLTEVSPFVNNARHEGPECVTPVS